MLVLMNHIYELNKGVRHMVLFTCKKKYSEQAIQRLVSRHLSKPIITGNNLAVFV